METSKMKEFEEFAKNAIALRDAEKQKMQVGALLQECIGALKTSIASLTQQERRSKNVNSYRIDNIKNLEKILKNLEQIRSALL